MYIVKLVGLGNVYIVKLVGPGNVYSKVGWTRECIYI